MTEPTPDEESVVESAPGRAHSRGMRLPELFGSSVFLGPTMLIVIGTLALPILYSLWLSLQVVDSQGNGAFGLQNYSDVFTDPLFGVVIRNTVLFAVAAIVGSTVIGLGMALVLNEPGPLRALGRVAVLVPWSMSQVAVGVIWGWIYNGSFGALNGALVEVGIIDTYRTWLNDGPTAFSFLAVAFIWSLTPYATLLFLSGLQGIPLEQYEAAKVDGAGAVQRFVHITVPWLRSTFLVVLVVASLEGFLAFTLIFMLTHGGPGNETVVLAWWGYATTFTYGNLEQGAAILYVLTLLVFATSLFYMRFLRRPIL